MTEQEKRDWVIEGLKCVAETYKFYLHDLATEAIDLLKAQEPRVMTLEEVRALQDGAAVWLEDNDKADVIPAIVNHIWNSLPNMASFTAAYAREVKADMLWYGVKWRCWTSRPTDAQRGKEPWNG
jgi:hypothetical protein